MPALSEVAAVIDGGVVVNVAALSSEVDYSGWMDAMAAEHDEVRIVTLAGVGWVDTPEGLRAPKPDTTTWVWDDAGWWVRPKARPEGVNYRWDEASQDWTYTGPPKPTIVEG